MMWVELHESALGIILKKRCFFNARSLISLLTVRHKVQPITSRNKRDKVLLTLTIYECLVYVVIYVRVLYKLL